MTCGRKKMKIYSLKFRHMRKKYPIGIQSFEKLRLDGYCYVDKTALLYYLVTTGQYYFLSRPRRFGKSLLISTLEAYFEGKRELFEGLSIAGLEKDWDKHPVLHLDLNIGKYDNATSLDEILNRNLVGWESLYGSDEAETTLSLRFAGVVKRACQTAGRRTVILVDEYDKPLLQTIDNPELQSSFRNTLKAFYGVLKTMDSYIRFAMLTGVTKFGKVSVFSDLNNLQDISMDERYANICGISEDELMADFSEEISKLAEVNGQSFSEACVSLKENYDGYHFNPWTSYGIYNPFSLLNTFAKNRYGSYWFETGTPTYLVTLLKASNFVLPEIEHVETDSDTIDSIFTDQNPLPVIYQSGYLTIKGYDREYGLFSLGFPNKEVEEGFLRFLMPYYTDIDKSRSMFEIRSFVSDIKSGNIDGFMKRLQSFLAGCNYELALDIERHYQNVLYIVFRLAGFYTQVEYRTSDGRVDLVLQTKDYVYIMEFKLDGSAEDALAQIEDKRYARQFSMDFRKIYKIGVNFSSQTRNIERWVVD